MTGNNGSFGQVGGSVYGGTVNQGNYNNYGQSGVVGNVVGNKSRSDNNTFVQRSEQKQTLAEAAAQIQQLLKQLEAINLAPTQEEKIAHLNDETTPRFKRRVVGALQAGGEAAIEEFLDNSYVNVVKETVKGWMKPE